MTKQEVMDKLEEIKGILDTDFLNRHTLEGVIDMVDNLGSIIKEYIEYKGDTKDYAGYLADKKKVRDEIMWRANG